MIREQTLTVQSVVDGEQYERCTLIDDGYDLRWENVQFIKCRFASQRLDGLELLDCTFEQVNLTNVSLMESIIYRTTFQDTRLMGVDFAQSRMKDTQFRKCSAPYSNYAGSTLNQVTFDHCDLRDTVYQSLLAVTKTRWHKCELVQADFSGTRLAGLDFTSNQIEALQISPELSRGCTVSDEQAPDFLANFGISVK